ncbi:MAG: M3 family oligoendopeptidase [Pseudomonadota bacterium]
MQAIFNRIRDVARSAAGAAETATGGTEALPEWDLSHLYEAVDAQSVEADMDRILSDSKAFEAAHSGKVADMAPVDLAAAIDTYEALQDLLGRLMSFAGLVYASDTSDPDGGKFYGDVQERITNASSHILFFALELNRIDDDVFEALANDPALARVRPWLVDLRRDKPFQLEDRLEQLFHEKSVTGRGAWNRLFDETITALRFDVNGEDLTIEPTLNLLQDRDPAVRKGAAAALTETFSSHTRTFTLITNTLAKDKEISDRWRGFEDIADSRHLANRVEREVVDALVSTVREAYPRLSHRYYAMKAKWLGMEKLNYWDRNAPLPSVEQRTYSWDAARSMVLDAYGDFSPVMRDIAGRFFDENWIDAPVRPGKSPGAFAHPTVPSAHPYVLVNFQGKPRDVMTLAHELGHGVHQVLAARQGPLMAPTPLTLAETASVFGEMLTFKALVAVTTDPAQQKALLASKVEDMINTVVRQIAFYTFERDIHTARREGELTADRIADIWMNVQTESLGPAIRLDEGYGCYWTYIPHFIHSPFYVYAYAFGDCLVNSLYAVYENAESGFQDKYMAMLEAGGTKHHGELLAPFGLNASDPEFWAKGVSVIEGLIGELEAMDAA